MRTKMQIKDVLAVIAALLGAVLALGLYLVIYGLFLAVPLLVVYSVFKYIGVF